MIGINLTIPNVFKNIHSQTKGKKPSTVNFSRPSQIETLSSDVRAFLPEVAQVLIGNDYLLNTRNPYVKKMLDFIYAAQV